MVSLRISSIAALALLSSKAIAQPIDHHVHRRDPSPVEVYVTVEETSYVTAGHEVVPSNVAPVASTFSYQTSVSGAPTFTSIAADSTAPTVLPKETSSPVESAASSASAPAASAASTGSTPVGSGGALGVAYSPYTNSGGCKSAAQVADDVAKLSGYSVIRLYGVDCDQVANVYAAKTSSQKLFVGVFDTGNIAGDVQTIHSGINGDWGCVHTVNIGNELVNDGVASVDQVAAFVQEGRTALTGLGYTGPVVTVDTFIATINNPGLCQISDYLPVNAHAFFDGGVAASGAGEWALQQIQRVYEACGGSKSVLISESGWPSQGQSNNLAVPSEENQQAAIASLKSAIGNDVLLFTAFNDYWKAPGAYSAEQYWGFLGSSDS